jgi:hypothetical protein
VNPTMIVQAKTTLDLYRVGVDIENGIEWTWDTDSDLDDDDCGLDPSYRSRRAGSASAGSPSVRTRRSHGGRGRSRLGAGSGACGEAGRGESWSPGRGESWSPLVTSPLPSSPMLPAETRRETVPAALQGKGKEPADDNDSRIIANAAAVADTDMLADADAAAGIRDSEEMVDASGSGDLEDGGREAAEPMGVEVRTLCVKTFCCGAIHVHTYFTLASTGMLACVYGVA